MKLFRRFSTTLVVSIGLTMWTASVTSAGGASAPSVYDAGTDVVQVSGGSVAATRDSGPDIRTFKAIPFAAPPIGDLRWQPPQPVIPWNGVRRADNFSPPCTQPGGDPRAIFYLSSEVSSENCLYLNVWTGASSPSERRPVMVYFYGGNNVTGSGSQPAYNGKGLASKGAVVVTFNYRLGPLGFLAHPELTEESPNQASGNYGLLDQIAVLQWIQTNIAVFGGDPANVTLYGASAGADDESVLMASPLARGLFQQVVAESGGYFPRANPNPALSGAEQAGLAFATAAGAASLADLRTLPATSLTAIPSAWGPVVDGYALPDQLDRLYASHQAADVPLLVGWNADDGTPFPPFATTLDEFQGKAQQVYGDTAPQFLALYPMASDADAQKQASAPYGQGVLAWSAYTLARAHQANSTSKTYVYHFTRVPPWYPEQHFLGQDPPSNFGAYHTAEQVYFFNTLDAIRRPYSDVDRTLSDVASSYLVNFATSGDPNEGARSGLPTWPTYDQRAGRVMDLGDAIAVAPVPDKSVFDFFDAFYTRQLGRPLPL